MVNKDVYINLELLLRICHKGKGKGAKGVKFTSELRDATCQWDHAVLSALTPTGQVGT